MPSAKLTSKGQITIPKEVRRALGVHTGDRLAFGTTTGSCWTSEDQGDSWRCLSTHLPPVYCVRFG